MANGQKTGGRQAGTPNKLTKELRAVLKNLLHDELSKLPEHFETLQPKERVELLVKLLPYVMPRIESVTYDSDEPNAFSWPLLD